MKKPKNTLSGYKITVDELAKSEIVLREIFLRGVHETLNNWGVEEYSVRDIEGMLSVLREYNELREEVLQYDSRKN